MKPACFDDGERAHAAASRDRRAAAGQLQLLYPDRRDHRAPPPRALRRHRLSDGLAGEDIPIEARVVTVADVSMR